jgi:RNA polymerase sigma-70 factor (sigma-E family)
MPDGVQGDESPERQEDVHEFARPAEALEIVPIGVADPVDPVVAPEPLGRGGGFDREAAATDVEPTFGEFYRVTYADMVRLAYLLTGSNETARDLVQDSYLRLHGAWDRVSEPRPYLRRSVINACHSHHRRLRRQRQHAATTRVDAVVLEADEMADAIAALPYRQRAAVVLRFWHDCSEAEIAAALGCRPGTVGSLIHRAIAELRKVIP